jgi:hypothetical protein
VPKQDFYQKRHPYGCQVRVRGIRDDEDKDLNGREGMLVRKWDFGFSDKRYVFGDVGIVIDKENGRAIKANLTANEYEELWDEF